MGDYFTEIMGNKQNNFVPMFNQKWKEELSSHNMPYCNARQMMSGNRLRPIMLAWGYYINTSVIKHNDILDYAICVELIHKASILLDDLIDNDNARHGLKTFHVEYSKTETILYAIYLINKSILLMYDKDCINKSLHTTILLKTVQLMTQGGIKEVCSNTFLSVEDTIEIINMETTALIENSFFLGYQLSSKKQQEEAPQEICDIGHLCGYCFQVLNDLEPFLAPNRNKEYKGSVNYDFEKKRKNIIISYLHGACTKKEKNELLNTNDFTFANKLINKYKIIDLALEDIQSKINIIKNCVSSIEKTNPTYYTDFAHFLKSMFDICFQKCGLYFTDKILYKG